jgi:hypothetical protein
MLDILAEIFGNNRSIHATDLLGDLFEGKNAAPCILVYAHTLMIAGDGNSKGPRYMKLMKAIFVGDHSKVKGFADQLNRALHCQ